MSHNTYRIEYAATGRSLCKGSKCKKGIEKGEIRIGKVYPSDRFETDGVATDWFHAKCLFESQKKARKTTKKVEDIDDLAGYDDLKQSDQKLISSFLDEQKKFFLSKPPSKSKPKKKDTSSKASSTWIAKDEDNDESRDDSIEEEGEDEDLLNIPNLFPTKPKQTNNNNNNNSGNNSNNSSKTTTTTTTTTQSPHKQQQQQQPKKPQPKSKKTMYN